MYRLYQHREKEAVDFFFLFFSKIEGYRMKFDTIKTFRFFLVAIFLFSNILIHRALAQDTITGTPLPGAGTPLQSAGAPLVTPTPVATNSGITTKVRAAFPNTPVMVNIAQCESAFRQFTNSGTVLRGGNGSVLGIFQIAELYATRAQAMGMNIYSVEGNIAFARYLYEKDGTDPWMSSFPCWNALTKGTEAPTVITHVSKPSPVAGVSMLESDLYLGVHSPEVLTLQQLLNHAGYHVAVEGPGSPGQETTKFGSFTRAAVRKFQCAKALACSGDEHSTGYGYVDTRTRAALLGKEIPSVAPTAPATTITRAAQQILSLDNSTQVAQLVSQLASLTQLVASLQQQLSLLLIQ
jgi:hypothetical protein